MTCTTMFKQICFFFMLLLVQMIAAGPAPTQPINGENPEFGRGRDDRDDRGDRRRDRWTWCRCVIDRRGRDRFDDRGRGL